MFRLKKMIGRKGYYCLQRIPGREGRLHTAPSIRKVILHRRDADYAENCMFHP